MTPRPLEVALHKRLEPFKKDSFLLAVSGGVDSMAMFYAFVELRKRWQMPLSVAYIHHGSGHHEAVSYRNQAFKVVQEAAIEHAVDFYSNVADTMDLSSIPQYGTSEEAYRKIRQEALIKIKKQSASKFVVFAHHSEDLLETRLMRLIRGCGPQGLGAMSFKRGAALRPFLQFKRKDMQDYLALVRGHFCEDPSNENTDFLRNWIRSVWLPALERRTPGSKAVLASSLNVIANAASKSASLLHCFSPDGKLIRSELLSLSLEEKKRVLAMYLKQKNVKNYGLSHVNELVKRLDVEKKELTFSLAQKNWLANARHIWCED